MGGQSLLGPLVVEEAVRPDGEFLIRRPDKMIEAKRFSNPHDIFEVIQGSECRVQSVALFSQWPLLSQERKVYNSVNKIARVHSAV
jgi:hypothetical protein